MKNLPHTEFLILSKQGKASLIANRSESMFICDNDKRISKSVKIAHYFWKWFGILMFISSCVSFLFINWVFGSLGLLVSFMVMMATQTSATQFVIEACYKDESLYEDCLNKGVVQIVTK